MAGNPFGYRHESGELLVDTAKAPVVRKMFETYIRTRSLVAVRDELRAMGLTTRRGSEWTSSSVQWVLTNPASCGWRPTKDGEEQAEHVPLVSRETFLKARETMGKSLRRHVPAPTGAARPPILVAFDQWRSVVVAAHGTLSRYDAGLRDLAAHGVARVEDVSVESVASYQLQRLQDGVSPKTLNVTLSALLTLLWWLSKRKLVKREMIVELRELKLPVREAPPSSFYTREQFDALRAKARDVRPWLRLCLDVATFTGVRVSELMRIDRGDLDLETNPVLRVSRQNGDTKSHKERVVPLCGELLQILRAEAPKAGPLFPGASSGAITPRSVQDAMVVLSLRAGVKATPHKSRRTFTTWALKAGVPAPTVARWLGHSDLTILYRHYYAHIPAYDPAIERIGREVAPTGAPS